jgi:hypothetical protein
MPATAQIAIAVVGIDIGKNSFHIIGLDKRGAIVLRQKWSRGQVEARFANMPPCLIGMEACVGAHHLSRKLKALGHDARLRSSPVITAPPMVNIIPSWFARPCRNSSRSVQRCQTKPPSAGRRKEPGSGLGSDR